MIILLHSSKTMIPTGKGTGQVPEFIKEANQINDYLKTLNNTELSKHMKISAKKAEETANKIKAWSADKPKQTLAIDTFRGDIYSGLQAQLLNETDRQYANKTLYILSGLYGFVRPLDGIMPYRLEMAYKFYAKPFDNFYKFWGDKVANCLSESGTIINTSSVEYSKIITPFVDSNRIITPQFFTMNAKTGKPTFVTIHSKIARGAFARWVIKNRINDDDNLQGFDLLGYVYDKSLSQPSQPAYVTKDFGGTGLSTRLQKFD